jgi:predicted RecA/RadA family phage recombinase
MTRIKVTKTTGVNVGRDVIVGNLVNVGVRDIVEIGCAWAV